MQALNWDGAGGLARSDPLSPLLGAFYLHAPRQAWFEAASGGRCACFMSEDTPHGLCT